MERQYEFEVAMTMVIKEQIDAIEHIPYIFLDVKTCELPTHLPSVGRLLWQFGPRLGSRMGIRCPLAPVPPCAFEARIRSEEEIRSQANFILLLVKLFKPGG